MEGKRGKEKLHKEGAPEKRGSPGSSGKSGPKRRSYLVWKVGRQNPDLHRKGSKRRKRTKKEKKKKTTP